MQSCSRAPVEGDADPLFARTGGVLSTELREKRLVIVGVGSVGSYLAEVLVRSGVGTFALIDPDVVDAPNLGRSLFTVGDLGTPKAKACARRLRTINPNVSIAVHCMDVRIAEPGELLGIIRAADLIIAATDDNAAQQRLNHFAYWAHKPAVFVGLYSGAAGGEVIVSREDLPCWECSTAGVRDSIGAVSVQPTTNYGTGRLTAVPGLLTDIHLVSAAAAKISLALLHAPSETARVSGFLDRPLRDGENYALFGTEPDYWFFPKIFANTLGQHAFQSVWLRTSRRADCPVCGPVDDRTNPLNYPTGGTEDEQLARRRTAYQERKEASAPREC
jgi:molybdopterin/thiamine biosynthesis adenylyltransferase